jgi:DNA polymerase elongation subunit (family B)
MKIAESVTFLGRQYILETKHIVEVDFAHYHTEVVYGDTDSVFVHYKDLKDTPKDLEEACRRGNEIAKKVTEYLRAKTKHDIIKLE